MEAWTRLDAFLAIEHNINYWEDDAVDYALELLEVLDDAGRRWATKRRLGRPPRPR